MQNKPRYADVRARLRNLGLANNQANHVIYSFKQARLSFGPKSSFELIAESQEARLTTPKRPQAFDYSSEIVLIS